MIGRILREQRASIRIGDGARVGIHRPSLGASARGGPKQGGEDAIVDAMMAIPADRIALLTPSGLAAYGLVVEDPN